LMIDDWQLLIEKTEARRKYKIKVISHWSLRR